MVINRTLILGFVFGLWFTGSVSAQQGTPGTGPASSLSTDKNFEDVLGTIVHKNFQWDSSEEWSLWDNGSTKTIIGQSATVPESATYEDLVVVGSKLEMKGRSKKLIAVGSDLGDFEGDVDELVLVASTVRLGGLAKVKKLVSVASNVEKLPGFANESTQMEQAFPLSKSWILPLSESNVWHVLALLGFFLYQVLSFFILWAFGLIVVGLFPKWVQQVTESTRQNWGRVLGLGMLGILAWFPLLILMILTLIGIFFVPFYLGISWVLYGLSQVIFVMAILQKIPILSRRSPAFAWTVGLIGFQVLLFVPYVGWLLKLAAVLIGLGAILMAGFQFKRTSKDTSSMPLEVSAPLS